MNCLGLLGIVALTAGGPQVNWAQFESVGFLEVTREKTGIASCTAFRIKGRLALTSAHCVDGILSARFTTSINPKQKSATWQTVQAAWIHPGYDHEKSNYVNDIAAICLPEETKSGVGLWAGETTPPLTTPIARIGWGERHRVNSREWTNPRLLGLTPQGTWISSDDFGRPGDSGGPLLMENEDGTLSAIGIHSTWEENTDKAYSVSIAAAKSWIDSLTCPDTSSADERTTAEPFVRRGP